MAKRRKVIHVESGSIFKTAAEAERSYNLPAGVLSEAIRLGKPCHGHIFRFLDDCDDQGKSSNDISEEAKTVPDESSSKPYSTVSDDSYSFGGKVFRKTDSTVYGASPSDKEAAIEYFSSLGYDVDGKDGVVMFYDADMNEVRKLIYDSGYCASWGLSFKKSLDDEGDEDERDS